MTEFDQNQGFAEVISRSSDRKVPKLAQEFYTAVRDSARFQWMGLSGAEDELGRPRLVIHLADRTEKGQNRDENSSAIPVTLASLALQLADPDLIIDLYYLRKSVSETPFADRALESVKARYSTPDHDPKPELLWEEDFVNL